MSRRSDAPVRLIVATRGETGPGEVLVKMRGGTEAYLAWSERAAAARDDQVLVYNSRGGRDRRCDGIHLAAGCIRGRRWGDDYVVPRGGSHVWVSGAGA